jgi:DNA-directed RNA polymerase subunit M/transcription elongation factor TFIIS
MSVTSVDRAPLVGNLPDVWLCQLSSDRPAYDCPHCKESGMQFFAERLDMPGRENFFYCHACGSNWEM